MPSRDLNAMRKRASPLGCQNNDANALPDCEVKKLWAATVNVWACKSNCQIDHNKSLPSAALTSDEHYSINRK